MVVHFLLGLGALGNSSLLSQCRIWGGRYASGTACRPRNWICIDLYSVSYEKGKLQQGCARKLKALAPNHTCQKIRLWESSNSEIVVIIHYPFQPISLLGPNNHSISIMSGDYRVIDTIVSLLIITVDYFILSLILLLAMLMDPAKNMYRRFRKKWGN